MWFAFDEDRALDYTLEQKENTYKIELNDLRLIDLSDFKTGSQLMKVAHESYREDFDIFKTAFNYNDCDRNYDKNKVKLILTQHLSLGLNHMLKK